MNEDIKLRVKQIFTGKVNFDLEQNVDYPHVDYLETNTLTHYLCYLAPDNKVYSNKTEYQATL
jgi:hypothetical protein